MPSPSSLRTDVEKVLSPGSASARKATNVTLNADLIAEARRLGVNISQAAEVGIRAAVEHCRQERWLIENSDALANSNTFVEEHGLPLAQHRQF